MTNMAGSLRSQTPQLELFSLVSSASSRRDTSFKTDSLHTRTLHSLQRDKSLGCMVLLLPCCVVCFLVSTSPCCSRWDRTGIGLGERKFGFTIVVGCSNTVQCALWHRLVNALPISTYDILFPCLCLSFASSDCDGISRLSAGLSKSAFGAHSIASQSEKGSWPLSNSSRKFL